MPRASIQQQSQLTSDSPLWNWGWALAAVIGMALFAPTITYEFTYDDVLIVAENFRIRDIARPANYLGTSYWDRPGMNKEYRPVVMLSYALNYAAAGDRVWAYHLINVVLHGLVCAAVWVLVTRLFRNATLATISAVIFAIHPMHVESVAGVVGRAELLSSVFFLWALLVGMRSLQSETTMRLWMLAICAGAIALLAFGTKENTATLIPTLMLVAWFSGDEEKARRLKKAVAALSCFAIAFGAYMITRRVVLGGFFSAPGQQSIFAFDNPLVEFDAPFRVLVATKLLSRYAMMLI